jgi:hypothetical protein
MSNYSIKRLKDYASCCCYCYMCTMQMGQAASLIGGRRLLIKLETGHRMPDMQTAAPSKPCLPLPMLLQAMPGMPPNLPPANLRLLPDSSHTLYSCTRRGSRSCHLHPSMPRLVLLVGVLRHPHCIPQPSSLRPHATWHRPLTVCLR